MPFTTPSPLSTQNQPPSTTGNPQQQQEEAKPYTYRLLPTWKPHRLLSGRIEYAEAGATWRRIPLPRAETETETETEDLAACLRRIHRTSRAWQARWWRANGWMFAYEKDSRGRRTRRTARDRRGAIAVVSRDEVFSGTSGAGVDRGVEAEEEKEVEAEVEAEAEEKREIEAAR
ncbi:MAG: hypothetical protein Q9214_007851, partial [Letrouitia sp. 1 TL-2023]